MRKIFILLLLFFCIPYTYATSDYNNIVVELEKITDFNQKLEKLNYVISISDDSKLNSSLELYKSSVISKNLIVYLKNYSIPDYNLNKSVYKKSFELLKLKDYDAGENPYYFLKLYKDIKKNNYSISSLEYKSFVYLFVKISDNYKNNPEIFKNYKSDLKNAVNQTGTYNLISSGSLAILKSKNINFLSKNDLFMLKNYIIKNNISTDTKTFQAYLEMKIFLDKYKLNSAFLKSDFTQKLQEKKLSCELNSTSLFLSYILQKEVLESDLMQYLSFNNSLPKKIGLTYYWGDPNKEFVGDINGIQTKDFKYFTGYGVYYGPISEIISNFGVKNNKSTFNSNDIISSILKNNPVMFWYVSPSKSGVVNTTPLVWKTEDKNEIKGYIGEHTGIITGFDFDNYGKITKLYFYEGRNMEVHQEEFSQIESKAKILNMMITKED